METAEKKRFKKTISEEELIRRARNNPMVFFELYPYRKIREVCVNTIKDRFACCLTDDLTKWLEECISAMLDQNDRFGEELLEWYICEGTAGENTVRAIEFGIKLKNKIGVRYNLLKFITGRLLKDYGIKLYPQIPSLCQYLHEILKELVEKRDGRYIRSDWIEIDRALKIIIAAGDFSFLPAIHELIILHRKGILKPVDYDPPYIKALNVAMLKETMRLLYRAQKEHLAKKKE